MSSDDINLTPDQRIENGLTSPLVFQDDSLRFNCGGAPPRQVGDTVPKTGGFIDDKMFTVNRDQFFTSQGTEFRRNVFSDRGNPSDVLNWSEGTPSSNDSDGEDDEDDDEDDDGGDTVVDRLVGVGDGSKRSSNSIIDVNNNNAGNVTNGKSQLHSPYGMNKAKNFSSYLDSKICHKFRSTCDYVQLIHLQHVIVVFGCVFISAL
jgi:hypothetical protein